MNGFKSIVLFSRELISNPSITGAACPSSPWLARRMASLIPRNFTGKVVEIGAGTGAVTQQLLKRGLNPKNLILLEMSSPLASHLKRRFPNLRVICGDASELQNLINQQTGKANSRADYIVSSLPFRSLPPKMCQAISLQMASVMGEKGHLIQFTYAIRSRKFAPFDAFSKLHSSIVWANIPPARVDLYRLQKPSSS